MADIISFINFVLPFVNSGMLILIVDLFFRSRGLEVTSREFHRKPLNSLFWALALIFLGNMANLILTLVIQSALSQSTPAGIFFLLFLSYITIVVNMTPKTYRRRKHK
jgi:hypothetical protein